MRLHGIPSVHQLGQRLGYARSERVRKVMAGENLPGYEMLADIARNFANINYHWLLTGEGVPIVEPSTSQAATTPPPRHAIAQEGNIIILDSKVAAGALQHYDQAERLRGQERMSLPWLGGSGLLAVQVDGDSMEPTILGGDWLVIRRLADPLHEIRAGHVYVVTSHNKALAKRLHVDRAGHAILCKSDNPAHADIRIKDERPVVYDVLAILREGVGDQRHNMQARLLRVEQEVERLKGRKG